MVQAWREAPAPQAQPWRRRPPNLGATPAPNVIPPAGGMARRRLPQPVNRSAASNRTPQPRNPAFRTSTPQPPASGGAFCRNVKGRAEALPAGGWGEPTRAGGDLRLRSTSQNGVGEPTRAGGDLRLRRPPKRGSRLGAGGDQPPKATARRNCFPAGRASVPSRAGDGLLGSLGSAAIPLGGLCRGAGGGEEHPVAGLAARLARRAR